MNNPLASSFGNFKLRSFKNKSQDEECLIDSRGKFKGFGSNQCKFPEKIFVINKGDRSDRWESFQINSSWILGNFKLHRWEATVTSVSQPEVVDAIFESFFSCLRHNLQEEESIIIMEDDCYLAPGGLEKIKEAWKDLPEDWDVLIGNHYFFGSIEILTDHLAKPTQRASTVNFGIYRRSILEKITSSLHLRENEGMRDFDHFITTDLSPINNFTVWPMVSREIPSFSDHKQIMLDSSSKIREHSFKYLFIDQDTFYPSLKGW